MVTSFVLQQSGELKTKTTGLNQRNFQNRDNIIFIIVKVGLKEGKHSKYKKYDSMERFH